MTKKIYFKDSANYFTYVANDELTRPLVVIVPGGGYNHTSKREAFNVASYFLELGFHAVVLNYREELDLYPTPQMELAYVIDYFRNNSKIYNIIPDKILNIGFSAGAHLVLSQSIYHNEYGNNSLPNGLVLCYPVVSSDKKFAHNGSFDCLLGDLKTDELLDKLSLEKHVTKELPDIFMWHTEKDNSVNILNSLKLYEAFIKEGVNCEYHVFDYGLHGMSLADDSMKTGGANLKDDYIHNWTIYLKNYLVKKGWIK